MALAGGYAADLVLGDPQRGHPVAGFGRLAQRIEAMTYAPSRARGAAYATALVGGAAAVGGLAGRRLGRDAALAAATWIALGGRSLTRVAARLADEVERGDLTAARATLPSLCGRDPEALDADRLVRGALESVAENTADAVVGALVWGAAAGPAGVLGYRAANTLDAMVGHRSARYREFGWASARLDDLLNLPVARVCALLTVACSPLVGGSPSAAARTAWNDGRHHPSPNAGRVEAAFAGALTVRLGGPLAYGRVAEERPTLGDGRAPTVADLRRAIRLSHAVGAAALLTCAVLR
ncbi:cobalamin biosynthesis protein [Baekduia soli]|uniref:Cobalamin biosynthesis protein CobD n=1 Tax=Baekduia soli TaxID=496014 RepID=A0A5B8U1Z8_9ACTN|nr:cobalamin biosynthesis protein [Baekduia soli]QEC47023.1 cobalamin biosynthesis protein [Baekduia soli]